MGRKKTIQNMLPPVTKISKNSKDNGMIYPEELMDFLINNYTISGLEENKQKILDDFNNRNEKDRINSCNKVIIDEIIYYMDGNGDIYTYDNILCGYVLDDEYLKHILEGYEEVNKKTGKPKKSKLNASKRHNFTYNEVKELMDGDINNIEVRQLTTNNTMLGRNFVTGETFPVIFI